MGTSRQPQSERSCSSEYSLCHFGGNLLRTRSENARPPGTQQVHQAACEMEYPHYSDQQQHLDPRHDTHRRLFAEPLTAARRRPDRRHLHQHRRTPLNRQRKTLQTHPQPPAQKVHAITPYQATLKTDSQFFKCPKKTPAPIKGAGVADLKQVKSGQNYLKVIRLRSIEIFGVCLKIVIADLNLISLTIFKILCRICSRAKNLYICFFSISRMCCD